jgi:hypothetical protein
MDSVAREGTSINKGRIRRYLRDLAFFVFGLAWDTIFTRSLNITNSYYCQQSSQLSQQMEDMMVMMQNNNYVQNAVVARERRASVNVQMDQDLGTSTITSMLLDLWDRVPEPMDGINGTRYGDGSLKTTSAANQASILFLVPALKPRPQT